MPVYPQLPNQLTVLRLILSAALFVVLAIYRYEGPDEPRTALLFTAVALFVIAAITDALDGYFARRWNVISKFGRVMDPFADKILVLGALILLAGPGFVIPAAASAERAGRLITGVEPWMVIVILARELLVTGIRGEIEGSGIQFAAKTPGKLKMILQSVVVPVVLLLVWIDPLAHAWAAWTRDILVWATVIVTILSGVPYVTAARSAIQREAGS